jgi:hypothetical protein
MKFSPKLAWPYVWIVVAAGDDPIDDRRPVAGPPFVATTSR